MRKEIIADFDDVTRHLKDGWKVEIGGDPVTLHLATNDHLEFRNLTLYKSGMWAVLADRTAVCTKPDEPVIGLVTSADCLIVAGYDEVRVFVPRGSGEQFKDKQVELRAVEP